MIALLGLGANLVNWAAGVTTVLVAVKHGWDLLEAARCERERRSRPDADNCR